MGPSVRNIAEIAGRYSSDEIAARRSVRSHAGHLQLTREQTDACIDAVVMAMRDGKSSGAAIGDSKQMAERFARPALRRNLTTPTEPRPAA